MLSARVALIRVCSPRTGFFEAVERSASRASPSYTCSELIACFIRPFAVSYSVIDVTYDEMAPRYNGCQGVKTHR